MAMDTSNAVNQALNRLLLGIGSIALLVSEIGVANTMIILRPRTPSKNRSPTSTRHHLLGQALLLSTLGGAFGSALGIGATLIVATLNGWPVALPANRDCCRHRWALYAALRTARRRPPRSVRDRRSELLLYRNRHVETQPNAAEG